MNSSWFDELTKALATATTRRQALRRVGGILGGSALTGLFPGLAQAHGADPCIRFCLSVFGEDLQTVECIVDAIFHKGLCYTCGPRSPGGTKPICCTRNSHGKCSSYHRTTCCASGETCQNGQCVTPTTTTSTTTTTTSTTTTTTSTTTTTTTPACVANGGSCSISGDCCSDICDVTTATCVSCIPLGDQGCQPGECCSGACNSSHICVSCLPFGNGNSCQSNSDCCSGLACCNGICLVADGGSCSNDSYCCSRDCCGGICCGGVCVGGVCE
jgi:hypothetical protein